MKKHFKTYASWLTTEIQDAGAHLDPEMLQLPGGSLIAAGLWLYSRSAHALKEAAHKCKHS